MAGLEQHVEITELQDEDLDRLKKLREARTSHTGASWQSDSNESALRATTIATESASMPIDQQDALLRDQGEVLSCMLKVAEAQRDTAQTALAVSQQELTLRSQQLIEAQTITEELEGRLQNADRERRERDKQWHSRCETIKGEWEERFKNEVCSINEDWRLRCSTVREEWSDKLRRDLQTANEEWSTRLKMKEMELKSQHQKEMDRIGTEAQWRDIEQKRLEQELSTARETIRLSIDSAEVEVTRRMALEYQLEDLRTRERIQPELVKALLLVDIMARQTSQATSFECLSMSLALLNLENFSKTLVNTEEAPNGPLAGDPKRRRLN
jgi:hypothetical protein